MRRRAYAAAVAVLALAVPVARAHDFQAALLAIRDTSDGRFEVLAKLPRGPAAEGGETSGDGEPAGASAPHISPRCRAIGEARTHELPAATIREWTLDCGPRGLEGVRVTSAGPAVVTVTDVRGETSSRVLRGGDTIVLSSGAAVATGGSLAVATTYTRLGIEHILLGLDHLMFVLALMLLVSRRTLLATITAFTVGHSVTLALAVFGVVDVPSAPVEALIAASIVLLAVDVARRLRDESRAPARPWLMAAGFGLLHGLGFAGALSAVGLPQDDLPLALASFNVGVEIGQLAFVLAALGVIVALRRIPHLQRFRDLPVMALGSIATFWFLQRFAAFWS